MAIERFGDFELDADTRRLRLRGREIGLQPRVFDLLAYLVRHRDRVVGKEELLSELWPGVIVTDASLQRAVSLARGALREGGLEQAIRTYARRGYRFCLSENSGLQDAAPTQATALDEALRLAGAHEWASATEAFRQADREQSLDAGGLEAWAHAAQCAGLLHDAVEPLERAAAAHAARDDARATARVNILLARIQLESLETAVARGSLRRAASLLADLPLCEQHGHLHWMLSRYCCYVGDIGDAIDHAQKTMEIGRRLNDPDLESIGMLYYGVATQAGGDTRLGIEMQDEAAATVLEGKVSPLIGGIVYCGLIAGCCNCGDWPRAGQWTETFHRWCQRMHLNTFAGSCILHRAEVFAARGDLDTALRELNAGAEILRRSAPWAEGDAYRVLGDLYLARGEFERSEDAYRQAHEHGWDPYPGYALLQFFRGDTDAALRGLQRACEPTHWVAGERRGLYLAYLAIIAAMAGRPDTAGDALARLEASPDLWPAGSVHAFVRRAQGELALATGKAETAAGRFRSAIPLLADAGLPIEAAVVRTRLADALQRAGDTAGAELELSAALNTFEKTQANGYRDMCARRLHDLRTG
jgi:DNA-binding winged helix-turn-helix (wHTH) protein/tetratricopeptide (TPR) repeat protein